MFLGSAAVGYNYRIKGRAGKPEHKLTRISDQRTPLHAQVHQDVTRESYSIRFRPGGKREKQTARGTSVANRWAPLFEG